MSQILLLTKNVLNEKDFENQLKKLGNEVYTSTELLEACIHDELHQDFLSMYQFVLLSETIENAEIDKLTSALEKYPIVIIRKTDEQLNEIDYQDWRKKGISEWIECNPKTEVLREKLSSNQKVSSKTNKTKRDISTLSLTNSELRLLYILLSQEKNFLSREELSKNMWNRSKNDSTMSHLSTLVKRLNQKLAEQRIDGPLIETLWGKGYRLHESVYEQLCFDSVIEQRWEKR